MLQYIEARVHNIYREESILLPYNPVESRSVKLWRNISEFICFFLYNQWCHQLNKISLKNRLLTMATEHGACPVFWWTFDASFWKILHCPVKALDKIHRQKPPFLHRYRYIVLLILAFLVLLKRHKTRHVLERHNFTLRDSTGLYGSRILSSLYIL